jgi:hypothetical protein
VNAAAGIATFTREIVHSIVQRDFSDAPAWIDRRLDRRGQLWPFTSHGVTA